MSDKAFVLVVEEGDGGGIVAQALRNSGHVLKVVGTTEEALDSIRHRPPDVIVIYAGDSIDEQQTQTLIQRGLGDEDSDRELILVAPRERVGSLRSLVGAKGRHGPHDVLSLPVEPDDVRLRVDRAARQVETNRQNRLMREQLERAFSFEGIVGTSQRLAKEIKRVSKLAATKSTILIVGESGTGKELLAKAIHNNSPRRTKAFMPVNCAALNENLLESELFGHVKGSFTGAFTDRKGVVESADGGTLFLDEIGDMPGSMQAKILRTLENGEVMRVGTNEVRYVDVRFVAATHRDLWALVEQDRFREDLFYRLHAHGAIRIPSLRERREDIPLLIRHFINWANEEHGRDIEGVSPDALRSLTNYGWRGNVRELKYVIERMVIEAESKLLDVEHLPPNIRSSSEIVPSGAPSLAGLSMADVERLHILNTLKLTGGNRERAANILKIGERTLYRKLKDYGLT